MLSQVKITSSIILGILGIVSFLGPLTVYAATVYSSPYVGDAWSIKADNPSYTFYDSAGGTITAPNVWASLQTSTYATDVNVIRVKVLQGTCGQLESGFGNVIYKTNDATGGGYSIGVFASSTDGTTCDATISPTILAGTTTSVVYLPTNVDVTLAGSYGNSGRSSNTFQDGLAVTGGFSYMLCDNTCDTDFATSQAYNSATRVISVTPVQGATVSDPYDVQVHAFIGTEIATTTVAIKIQIYDDNYPNGTSAADVLARVTTLFAADATTSGDFYYTATASSTLGNYHVRAAIADSALFGWLTTNVKAIQNQYVVGTSTVFGALQTQEQRARVALLGEATSTAQLLSSCAVFNTGFSIVGCSTYLFQPDTSQWLQDIGTLANIIIHVPPFGYFTRLAEIIVTTSAAPLSSLPHVYLPFYQLAGGAGVSMDLTPWDKLMGQGTIISTATAPDGSTLRSIVEPKWDLFVYLLAVLAMAYRASGMSALAGSYEAAGSRENQRQATNAYYTGAMGPRRKVR